MSHNCQLTDEGIRAAERVSEAYEEGGGAQAKKIADEIFGWEPLGKGVSRVAFDPSTGDKPIKFVMGADERSAVHSHGDGECVIKISRPHHRQMSEEIRQWRLISGDKISEKPWEKLEPVTAPVLDYDKAEHRWLTMPKGDTQSATMDDVSTVTRIAREAGFLASDIHQDNVAIFDTQPKMIDLGHDFKYTGYTEWQEWDAYEDFLERIGCEDVYTKERRRQFQEVMFDAPLDMPGDFYYNRQTRTRFTLGGNLVEMNLYVTEFPMKVTSKEEVAAAIDKVVDVEEAWRQITTDVMNVGGAYAPKVEAAHAKHEGPPISEVQPFLSVFYDRYEAIFGSIMPDETPERDVSLPDFDPERDILGDIESEFAGL